MKIHPDDYAELEAAIRPQMQELKWEVFRSLKVSPKVWRWCLVDAAGLRPWIRSDLGYLSEAAVDAALRRITKS